jgi:ATP-binding protein involved in chromosome partitioning
MQVPGPPSGSRLFGRPPQEKLKPENIRRILVVASGKGGVGKSTVAVNLALALARTGLRVGLLDADIHGPNVPLMLGVRRKEDVEGWQAIVPLADNPLRAPERRLPALHRYGIAVMSLGLLVGEEQATMVGNVSLAGILARNLLTLVEWGDLDVLLLDLPPGTGEPQATLLATVECHGVVLVVGPQDLALLDTSRALRNFEAANVPVVGVVENMSYLVCPHCGERIQVFHRSSVPRSITNGDIPLLAQIPIEPALSEAADTGRPVLVTDPDGPQSTIFLHLAEKVAERMGLNGEDGNREPEARGRDGNGR